MKQGESVLSKDSLFFTIYFKFPEKILMKNQKLGVYRKNFHYTGCIGQKADRGVKKCKNG